MKAKMRQLRVGEIPVSSNEQVLVEIQSFLQALDSYPERFAQQPGISFEEHRCCLAQAVETQPRRDN